MRDLRATQPPPSRTGIPELDRLWTSNGGKLAISDRGISLLYHIINHLVTVLNGTVALVDVNGRFSPTHLDCDLKHVHVFRPTQSSLKITLESVEEYMIWGGHGSQGREWLGTLVNGGVGGDINVGWGGWLRVERENVEGFSMGMSVEEALGERGMRQQIVDPKGWKAVSETGEFRWT